MGGGGVMKRVGEQKRKMCTDDEKESWKISAFRGGGGGLFGREDLGERWGCVLGKKI
jgi:hypothetical protein